ncbi:uncharacterized protein LOC119066155 [Bradysia coprophila]|uniref:uncharacterized protein LOC119066155 n=1 Tax=Bradysia coprophila TaxID=38358 RepID=UPI00187DAA3A|nr:uncharacterized protein LOC119066155 [Bradysia coprophila]
MQRVLLLSILATTLFVVNGQQKICVSMVMNLNLDPGHDISMQPGTASWEACCEICKATPTCQGFVYNNLKACWLKYTQGPFKPDLPKWQTHAGLVVAVPGGPVVNPTPTPTPKPLVCLNPVEQAEAVKLADSIAALVDAAITIGAVGFNDPAKRQQYLDVKSRVFAALQNGWAAPGVCDAIANSTADPLTEIPDVGAFVSGMVKTGVKKVCEKRKSELGC